MKKSTRVSVLTLLVTSSLLIAVTPAYADPWSNTVTVGGTEWNVDDDAAAISHTYGGGLDSTIHRFGGLRISDWGPWCDTATAVMSTDAATGDVIIMCDAQESLNDSGLFVTPQYRLYAGGDLARMFFTIENRSASDITATNFYLIDEYDCYDLNHSSSGGTGYEPAATDTWNMTSQAGCMVGGTAWAVTGNTSTMTSGHIYDDEEIVHDFVDLVFPAGSTKYVASFAISVTPTSSDEADALAALATAVAAAPQFDTFSGRLVAGLPAGITVINWGGVAAAPALAATGSDASAMLPIGIVGGVVLLAGIALLI
ncbi:MAG: hypothetical protein ABL886_17720, partial [Rhodoglobus sp.]